MRIECVRIRGVKTSPVVGEFPTVRRCYVLPLKCSLSSIHLQIISRQKPLFHPPLKIASMSAFSVTLWPNARYVKSVVIVMLEARSWWLRGILKYFSALDRELLSPFVCFLLGAAKVLDLHWLRRLWGCAGEF
jgi:hypothetical protein